MTEHDAPVAPRRELTGESPMAPAGQALTSLLELHRRGVIDDEQFADLSRSLTGAAAAAGRRHPSRRVTVMVAAAGLALAAGGVSVAMRPHSDAASLKLSSAAAASSHLAVEARPTAVPSPSISAKISSASAAPQARAVQVAPSPSPKRRTTVALRSSSRSAVPAAAAPVRKPALAVIATKAPVAKPAAPRLNCSAYSFAKEDNRNTYESRLTNNGIDFNMALNSGNLDEAARLQSNGEAIQQQWSLADARLLTLYPGC